jgi:D-serine deaminase-like pyridoxal phosphate-dependent protein
MAGMNASPATRQPIAHPGHDARIGRAIEELDTPTLLLDRAASDRNLALMASYFRDRPSKLRPHFKNHKCVTLAKRQMQAGAVGMTCAKLGEAEVLVDNGFQDVLIANQVVGSAKIERLVQLAKRARIAVAVDHFDQVAAISRAATAGNAVVRLLIEVDIGMGRCGIPTSDAVLDLARKIVGMPGVEFGGLQAYEGHLVNVIDREQRRSQSRAAMALAVETRRLLERSGISVPCISGCSSATYDSTGILDGVDEIQAGTYATMDRQYFRLAPEFEIALSILVRVISRPGPDKAVLDVGVKGAGAEFGVPGIRDYPDVVIPFFLAEEHVVVNQAPDWPIGQPLHLIPSHACTTCNLYREMVVHENGVVTDVWPIEGSGRLA